MVYAVLYIENGDVVGTYGSMADAERDLTAMVQKRPQIRDEIGIRPYDRGRPVGAFQSASELLGDTLPQDQAYRLA